MRLIVASVATLMIVTHAALAQQITTGTIQGTVTDATGASLPGVTVEARNVAINLASTQVSGNDGRYVFLQLPPGSYRMTFSLPGFATLVQENVTLTVGQALTLPAAMKVAGVAETVTVSTTQGVIESTRTSAATTLNELTVESLPILGRKFEDLLTLTPGVSIVQGPDGDEITFAGQRGIFNNISLDGGDYNNGFFGEQAGGQRAAIDITLDAVKEFQVIATGAPAEFGRTAGGVVNVITKSGTNRPHGTLFYFQRLEDLTSELSDGTNLDGFHREQWGGTFGGPIATDKAFFFGALEGITGNFTRPNLGRPIGDTPCPVAAPTIPQHEALINEQRRLPAHGAPERSSTSGWEWTRAGRSSIRSRPSPRSASSMRSPTAATGLPRRGTSITRRRRTRPSTSPPTGRLPTASKATPRASMWATSTGSPRCPIGC